MARDPSRQQRVTDRPDIDLTRDDPADMRQGDRPARVERAMREEAQDAWAAPSIGVVSKAQVRGGLSGGIAGGIVGAVIGVAVGLLPLFDMATGLRVLVVGAIFAVAGATIGGLLGGFFEPDWEGETGSLPGEGPRSVAERRSGRAE